MGLGGRRGLQLTWRSHVSIITIYDDTISGGDPKVSSFLKSTLVIHILANEIPEYLIIALLIRILH